MAEAELIQGAPGQPLDKSGAIYREMLDRLEMSYRTYLERKTVHSEKVASMRAFDHAQLLEHPLSEQYGYVPQEEKTVYLGRAARREDVVDNLHSMFDQKQPRC